MALLVSINGWNLRAIETVLLIREKKISLG